MPGGHRCPALRPLEVQSNHSGLSLTLAELSLLATRPCQVGGIQGNRACMEHLGCVPRGFGISQSFSLKDVSGRALGCMGRIYLCGVLAGEVSAQGLWDASHYSIPLFPAPLTGS